MVEQQLAPSGLGTVMLDIGGNIGALVVEFPSQFLGRELDLTAVGATQPLMHTEVRERRVGGSRYAAVYPAVPAGSYTIEGSEQICVIEGGRVTSSFWGGTAG